MTDLDIEFEHIYIEAKAERWQCIERFLFSYFCFRENYLTRKNKPDWQSARLMSPRSAKITAIENAILEPVVPHQTIIGEIKRYWRDGQLTRQSLQRILNQLLDYAVITHKEKAALSKARLGDSMPADWYKNPEKPVYQRFELVNITLIHV